MLPIKVWFPDFYTEAHRQPGTGQVLVDELKKLDVHCQLDPSMDCDFVLAGGTFKNRDIRHRLKAYGPSNPYRQIPIIHYCWDLYPFQLNQENEEDREVWRIYVQDLRECKEIWVPSVCTVRRVQEFTGRTAEVLPCSVRTWEPSNPHRFPSISKRPYVVDVMRKYPDPNEHACKETCDRLGLACVEMNHQYDWEDFKDLVAGASLLVSAYYEASTGGLTLLEGLWHGVPCLCSDSPRNGAVEYLKKEGRYFKWGDRGDLEFNIVDTIAEHSEPRLEERRAFIQENYSEAAFALRIANRLKVLKYGS